MTEKEMTEGRSRAWRRPGVAACDGALRLHKTKTKKKPWILDY